MIQAYCAMPGTTAARTKCARAEDDEGDDVDYEEGSHAKYRPAFTQRASASPRGVTGSTINMLRYARVMRSDFYSFVSGFMYLN